MDTILMRRVAFAMAIVTLAVWPLVAQKNLPLMGVGGGGGSISYSIGNSISAQNGGAGASVTTASITITAGQAVAIGVNGCGNSGCSATPNTSFTVSDTLGDSPTCVAGTFKGVASAGQTSELCYVCSSAGGTGTFTATQVGTASPFYTGIGVAAVNGIKTSACADTSSANGSTSSSTNPTVTSNSVAQGSEFVFGIADDGVAVTAGQTNIIRWNANQTGLEYKTGSASGTQTLTWTASSSAWTTGILGLEHP